MYLDEDEFYDKKLVDSINYVLDGDDYDTGQLEAARQQADNASLALSNLLVFLNNKGIISKEEIYEVTTGYESERRKN